MERLLARWADAGRRGVLVGPKGSGKTTLLLELQKRLPELGFQLLPLTRRPGEPPLTGLDDVSSRHVVTLDGAQRLGFLERLRLRRRLERAGGLIATSHRPLSWLPTLLRHRVDGQEFVAWVEELTAARGFDCPWSRQQLADLLKEEDGNAREAFRRLYDRASRDFESDLGADARRVSS